MCISPINYNLSYKIRPLGLFSLGEAVFFLTEGDGSHQERHIIGKGAHCLKALGIILHLTGDRAVNAVPILTCRHRHAAIGQIFIELIKCRRATASAGNHDRRAHLHSLIDLA